MRTRTSLSDSSSSDHMFEVTLLTLNTKDKPSLEKNPLSVFTIQQLRFKCSAKYTFHVHDRYNKSLCQSIVFRDGRFN